MSVLTELESRLSGRIREHVPVGDLTSLGTGGVADYYTAVTSVPDLIAAVEAAWETGIPYFVLGHGAGILWSDSGFPGLVIHNQTSDVTTLSSANQVIVDSGVMLDRLVHQTASLGLGGLAFLINVPGTVGGATYNNVSAHGGALSQYVRQVAVLDLADDNTLQVRRYGRDWWQFGYRTSRLKERARGESQSFQPVILTVTLQLNAAKPESILRSLGAMAARRRYDAKSARVLELFQNPNADKIAQPGSREWVSPQFPAERTAGYMLDKIGARQVRQSGLRIAGNHANYLEHTGGSTSNQAQGVVHQLAERAREQYGLSLKENFEYIGVWG